MKRPEEFLRALRCWCCVSGYPLIASENFTRAPVFMIEFS